jgi:hypothetical protein
MHEKLKDAMIFLALPFLLLLMVLFMLICGDPLEDDDC